MPPVARASSFPLRAAILVLTISLFGCDHATKIAAKASLPPGGFDVVSGVLELRYTPNPDVAFSLLHALGLPRTPGLLIAMSAAALLAVLMTWFAARKNATRAQHVGFALVLAGALGNVVDRVVRGFVIDFIHLTHWPVFNVADIAVVVGMILLVAAALRKPPPDAAVSGA